MTTEAQKRATRKYSQKYRYSVTMSLNKKYDKDIIAWISAMNNKQAYLKDLIRRDMPKGTE